MSYEEERALLKLSYLRESRQKNLPPKIVSDVMERVNGELFSFYGTRGRVIVLERLQPSFCPFCSSRRKRRIVHETDYAFLIVNPGRRIAKYECGGNIKRPKIDFFSLRW